MFGKRDTDQLTEEPIISDDTPEVKERDNAAKSFHTLDIEEADQTELKTENISVRLQRARTRIWADLRDGIDLKSLG